MADDGKVLRVCKLASCGVSFEPRRKDHYFHLPQCRQSYFSRARAVGLALFTRLGRFLSVEEIMAKELELSNKEIGVMSTGTDFPKDEIMELLAEVRAAESEMEELKGATTEQRKNRDGAITRLLKIEADVRYGSGPLFEKGAPAEEGPKVIAVEEWRFADGTYEDGEKVGKAGDIAASYSGDIIPEGKVKRPFKHVGVEYVNVGGTIKAVEAYRIIPASEFEGEARKYGDLQADVLRLQPEGFYHGMLVTYKKKDYVLVGPEVKFVVKKLQEGGPGEDPGGHEQEMKKGPEAVSAGQGNGPGETKEEPTAWDLECEKAEAERKQKEQKDLEAEKGSKGHKVAAKAEVR